jgi:hypothetical protein
MKIGSKGAYAHLVLCAILAAGVRPAGADTVIGPFPFTQVIAGGSQQSQFSTGTDALTITNPVTGGTEGASATVNVQPSPNESVSATVIGGGTASARAQLSDYFFVTAISSAPTGTPVSLIITASGAVTQAAASLNSAQLYFGNNVGTTLIASACTAGGANSCLASGLVNTSSFSITDTVTTTVGVQNLLTLDLFVNANTLGFHTDDSQSGFIDPIISFANPNDALLYQLVFAPGVGNLGAVPEPSTWAMMILGFAGIGFVAYRRKSKPAFMAV